MNVLSTWLSLLPRLVLMVVWLVAAVLAIRSWSRHPRVSLFVLIAVAILIVNSLIGWGTNTYLPLLVGESGFRGADLAFAIFIINTVSTLVNAFAWVLVVAAIFTGRSR